MNEKSAVEAWSGVAPRSHPECNLGRRQVLRWAGVAGISAALATAGLGAPPPAQAAQRHPAATTRVPSMVGVPLRASENVRCDRTPVTGGICVTSVGALYVPYTSVNMVRVKSLTWAQLHTSPGVYNWEPIDTLLAQNPKVYFELGIDYGYGAPEWVKSDPDIGSIAITNKRSGESGYVANATKAKCRDYFLEFTLALGARYDSEPHIVAVISSYSQGKFTEPPLLTGGDTDSAIRLHNAGYNQETLTQCWNFGMAVCQEAWPSTSIVFATHSDWQIPGPKGVLRHNWPAMRSIMLDWITPDSGRRIVLADYGLSDADTATRWDTSGETLTQTSKEYCFMRLAEQQQLCSIAWQLTLRPVGGRAPTQAQLRQGYQNACDMGAVWCEHASAGSKRRSDVSAVNAQSTTMKNTARKIATLLS